MVAGSESFARVCVKVERAKKHIRDLEIEVSAFLRSRPYTVGVRTEHQKTVYYLANSVETPGGIAAITGDVLFNLRAALDHLVYRLAEIENVGEETLRVISFPIFNDSANYNAQAPGRLKGLGQKATSAINATEPYNGGKGYLLWRLHKLNNIDKHRILITVGCQLSGFRLHTTRRRQMHKAIHAEAGINLADSQADAFNPFLPPDGKTALTQGAVLVRDLFANEEEDQSEKFAFDLALDEAPIIVCEPLIPTLIGIASHVETVINNFEPLLV